LNGLPIAKRHYRLKLADALSAHDRALRTGGLEGVPNPGLIEAAIARPYTGYYPQIWQKAAALVQSMAANHGFADGNKRSTLLLVYTLITNSGYRLKPLNKEDLEQALEDIIVAGASHKTTIQQLTEWFRLRVERPKKPSPGAKLPQSN
jgi:death on curing protein